MFKIHDDKVYFVAETPDINKVIEIFLPKDDRGTIMDSHEIRVDLCRAVIHECRWAILKDAIQKRGHEAVADFVGTDISSDTYDRVMDETEAQMPDEEFERFWEKYI